MPKTHVPNKIRREQSDLKILRAAVKNFGKFGYANSSIYQIAKDAGVSPGLITNRYASKEALFEASFAFAFQTQIIDYSSLDDAIEFLTTAIRLTEELYTQDIDAFNFLAMAYTSYDRPEKFLIKSREEFMGTRVYKMLLRAQNDGMLQKGDIINLIVAFLAHLFIQIGICGKYGLDLPSDDYFLSAILPDNINEKNFLNQQYIDVLLMEYQSAWLINVEDQSITIFKYDDSAVPNSVETAQKIRSYNDARLWYIENCVVEQSKNMLLEKTDINYIIPQIIDGEPFFIEYGRLSEGKINYNQLCYSRIVNRKGEMAAIAMGFRNIDKIKKATIDGLTGLLTRREFFKRAEQVLKDNPDISYDLEISDVIDFKKINEIYGVTEADKIIKWVANFLVENLDNDFLIGKYGGDQFVVMGPSNRMQKILEPEQFQFFISSMDNADIPKCEMKFGIYEDIPHDISVISICDKAHSALNTIKRQYGKVRAYYTDTIKENIDRQRKIEDSMDDALKKHQFKVYYQPKHNANTGELVGAEALVRWEHPEYGFMSPAEFIPLFEQNGFIANVDNYVWWRTCENLRRWADEGINTVPISVNASRLSMMKEDLVEDMSNAISRYDLEPDQLHIEVTETLMTLNTDEMVNTLNRIRELGCKVELDDFGSGYSSLNMLSTIPIDILKLDRTFLNKFGDEKRMVVLESCIDMAQKLGFETVSEGVELSEQRELLRKLGVDIIQGYYYSQPLPEDEFVKYMQAVKL